MEELKNVYNNLLARKKAGQKYLEEKPNDTKALEALNNIQGELDRILIALGDVSPEEVENGFKVQPKKNQLAVSYTVDNEEITLTPDIVQEYITGSKAGKITKQEFMMFASLCKARKLNPFLKEAYCIKYSDNQPATIVVGKDAFVKRASLHPQFNGMKSGVMVVDQNGNLIKRDGTFKLPEEILVGGWAEVFRKDWANSIYTSASLDECIQRKKDGTPNSNWKTQPAVMIEKVCKVRALREAFVEEFGGLYTQEEIIEDNTSYDEENNTMGDIL